MKEEHQTSLFNAQDCRNKFNYGCPIDPLDNATKRLKLNNK